MTAASVRTAITVLAGWVGLWSAASGCRLDPGRHNACIRDGDCLRGRVCVGRVCLPPGAGGDAAAEMSDDAAPEAGDDDGQPDEPDAAVDGGASDDASDASGGASDASGDANDDGPGDVGDASSADGPKIAGANQLEAGAAPPPPPPLPPLPPLPPRGTIGGDCVATLITAQHAVVPSRCLGSAWEGDDVPPFALATGRDTAPVEFAINRIHHLAGLTAGTESVESSPDGFGVMNFTLVRLSTPVPAALAEPVAIAPSTPGPAELVGVIGDRCADAAPPADGDADRGDPPVQTWRIGEAAPCLIDRGGPAIVLEGAHRGAVWGIHLGSTEDVRAASSGPAFANISFFKERIAEIIQAWSGGVVAPGIERRELTRRVVPTDSAPTANQCAGMCAKDLGCRAFTFFDAWGSDPARCELKGGAGDWAPCPNCTSGLPMPGYAGLSFSGTSDRVFASRLAERCRADCTWEQEWCAGYTFIPSPSEGEMGTCTLRRSLGEVIPCDGCTSGADRSLTFDVDRPGMDYKTFTIDPPSGVAACRRACGEDGRCGSFSYTSPSGQGRGICRLKLGVPPPRPASGVISAVRRGLEFDINRWGGDFHSFLQPTPLPEICQAACYADSRCYSFTYVPPGIQAASAVCWLKVDVSDFFMQPGMVAGLSGPFF